MRRRRQGGQDGGPEVSGGSGYPDQVGHRRRHGQLEERLRPANVARLAHAQLHEASQTVLNHLAAALTVFEGWAVLERPSLLDEGFLGMHLNGSAVLAAHALCT